MRMRLILVLLVIFLFGCSKEAPIIIQEESESLNETFIDLVEEFDKEERIQYLEFTLIDQQISLNIDKIPILRNYLENHIDQEQAIQEMQLTQIVKHTLDNVFLLSFACENKMCSYLLINTDHEYSQLLADQANIIKIKPSPDQSYLFFQFDRKSSQHPWSTSKLIMIDLEKWEEIPIEVVNEPLMTLNTFQWPIHEIDWINDSEVTVTIPDIETATTENLTEWYHSENKAKKTITVIPK